MRLNRLKRCLTLGEADKQVVQYEVKTRIA